MNVSEPIQADAGKLAAAVRRADARLDQARRDGTDDSWFDQDQD
jgi:hypothetical protein